MATKTKTETTPEAIYLGRRIIDSKAVDRMEEWVDNSVDPKRLKWQEESVASGMLVDQQRAIRTMLTRWAYLQKALLKLGETLSGYTWSVTPYVAPGASAATEEDAEFARCCEQALAATRLVQQGRWQWDFDDLIEQVAYAQFRGSTVAQIEWAQGDGLVYPAAFTPVPAKYYGWTTQDDEPDELVLYPRGIESGEYRRFPEGRFVVALGKTVGDHPIFGARLISLIPWFIAAEFGLKEALLYCKRFAQPIRVARAGSAEARKQAAEMMRKMGNSAWMVCPKNIELEIIQAASAGSGGSPQLAIVQAAQNQVDVVIGGQKLASGTSDTGSNSRALGQVHNAVRQEGTEALATYVAKQLRPLLAHIIKLNFGRVPVNLPELRYTDPTGAWDRGKLEYVTGVINAGIGVTKDWVYKQLEIPQPAEGEELFSPQNGGGMGEMPYGPDAEEDPYAENPLDAGDEAAPQQEDEEWPDEAQTEPAPANAEPRQEAPQEESEEPMQEAPENAEEQPYEEDEEQNTNRRQA